MKRPASLVAAAVLVVCFALLSSLTLAQSSANFGLWWHLIAGGGGRSTSSSYAVSGSIGQPLVGASGNAGYGLRGGFWPGLGGGAAPTATATATLPAPATPTLTLAAHRIHLPVIMRSVWVP